MAEPTPAEIAADWASIGQQIFAGGIEAVLTWDGTKATVNVVGTVIGDLLAVLYTVLAPIGIGMAKGMSTAEDLIAPAFADMAAAAVNDVFGTNVPGSAFAQSRGGGGRRTAGQQLGKGLMDQLRGAGNGLAPGSGAAEAFVGAMAGTAIEDWFKGWFFEVLSSLVPWLDVGKIESYGALGDKVTAVLGLGRISSRVLRPIADVAIVTPLEWQVNINYRPKLLSASETARQVARGKLTREKGIEELAKQGYDDKRIEMLFNAAEKAFSPSDVRTFESRGHWSNDRALQHLRDQGYTAEGASDALRLEGLKRFEQLETQEANAAIAAYASGDIDHTELAGILASQVRVESERHLFAELAEVRRACNVKHLSLSQVEQMVKSHVLSVVDYRRTAEREGYRGADVAALELQLRWELDKEKSIEDHRAEQLAQRAAEAAAKAAAAEERKAAIAADRALARRGSESDLERAVVRGILPIAELADVYAQRYDPATVDTLLELVEGDRLAFLEREAARVDAIKRGQRRNVDVGALEAAVVARVIGIDTYRARLEGLGFEPADARLLADTLEARIADRAAAVAAREAAIAAAKVRSIDLPRYEQLVRRGARTFAQYDAVLGSLGFEAGARADLAELLRLQVAEDEAARQARAEAEARLVPRGLSLEQFRRAVLLGTRTLDDLNRFLVEQRFTADAQEVLMADARAAVAEADAARQRRESEDRGPQAPGISLATLRRAARLGTIAPDTYAARLEAEGWSADDVAIDLDLLLLEIAEVQAARAKRSAPAPAPAVPGLTLAQLERAVKSGAASVNDYRARAIALGYSAADVDTLAGVLGAELEDLEAARARQAGIALQLAARGVVLEDLEAGVRAGQVAIADYERQLEAWGFSADDGELLGSLLQFALEGSSEGGA